MFLQYEEVSILVLRSLEIYEIRGSKLLANSLRLLRNDSSCIYLICQGYGTTHIQENGKMIELLTLAL